MEITLKNNNHVINANDIKIIYQWNKEFKGYSGTTQYKKDEKTYIPYLTKKEIETIKEHNKNVKIENIKALKYFGTY